LRNFTFLNWCFLAGTYLLPTFRERFNYVRNPWGHITFPQRRSLLHPIWILVPAFTMVYYLSWSRLNGMSS
jgi:hypothetical protein